MATTDLVRSMVEPLAVSAGARVYDVTMNGGKLVVALTRDEGIDLETLTDVARQLNARLDEEDPISGSYTLEVTSPGLERTLRTPEHFAGAVGAEVTIRTKPGVEGERRVRGVLRRADDDTVTVDVEDDGGERELSYDDIARARTVFHWGAAGKPKPGAPKHQKQPENNPASKKRERS